MLVWHLFGSHHVHFLHSLLTACLPLSIFSRVIDCCALVGRYTWVRVWVEHGDLCSQYDVVVQHTPNTYSGACRLTHKLVQVRLCPKHALQLNYRKNKEVLKMQRTEHKRQQKRLRKAARKRRKSAGDQQEAAQLNALESEPETTSSSEQLDRYSGARKARTSGMHMSTLPATPAPDKQDIPPGSSPQHSPTVPAVHAKAEADQQRQAQQRWNNDGLAASSSQQEHIYCEDVEDADLLSELLM